MDFIFYLERKGADVLILELKVDSTPEEAVKQIKDKKYAMRLKESSARNPSIQAGFWQLESVMTEGQRNISVRWRRCLEDIFEIYLESQIRGEHELQNFCH